MMYRQITFAERYTLGLLRQRGVPPATIARLLGRHRSSIGRELRRNRSHSDGTYRPQLADWYARGRRARSRRNQRFSATDWARIAALLHEDWSPEQIAGRLRREGGLRISHETIYRRIWQDKRAGGDLYRHLRGARKQRRKRYGAYDSRGRLAGKRPSPPARHATPAGQPVWAVEDEEFPSFAAQSAPEERGLVIVRFERSAETSVDRRRLDRIHGLLVAHPGADHFRIVLCQGDREINLDFPNHTTGFSEGLAAELRAVTGVTGVRWHKLEAPTRKPEPARRRDEFDDL